VLRAIKARDPQAAAEACLVHVESAARIALESKRSRDGAAHPTEAMTRPSVRE
jgi:DNA-binding GntR family transcriptional regulator